MFKNLMLVAVAAMAFTACTKENNEVNAVAKKTVINFTANFDDDTRSHFGEYDGEKYPSFWEGGEQVAIVAPAADYEGTYTAYAEAVKLDDEGKSATFTVVFDNPIEAGTVYAYVGQGWNELTSYAYVANYQTPRANSVDPRCHMTYTSFEYDGSNTMDVNGTFKHGAAYGKMTINGFDDKKITEVVVNIVGEENSYTYTLNTEELAEHTYWFASEACEAKEFTVSVVADGVAYSKTIALTEERPLNFKIGHVSKFSVSKLTKDPVQLETPIISASFADGKVTATWEAIENAAAYEIEINDEVVESAYTAASYTFDAEYNTQYNIAVTAKAKEDSTEYIDSYKGNTYFTTPMDINMEVDYTVTLTSYAIVDSTYKFEGKTANDWIKIPFHTGLNGELPAGTYTGVYGGEAFSANAALEYDWFNTSFNIAEKPSSNGYPYWNQSNGIIVVERGEGNTLSLTAIVSAYIDGYTKTVKYVYEEVYTEPVTFDGEITKWTYTNSLSPTKYLVEGNGFSFYVGMNRNNKDFIAKRDGDYSLGDSSWYMKHFSIHDISIPSLGDNLSVTDGKLKVNEGGTAGAIHDIDITLTINGAEYEFTYYGYINGEAVENGGGSEPEPEIPANLDITLTSMSKGVNLSSYFLYEFVFTGEDTEFTLGWSDTVASETSIENKTYNFYTNSYSYIGSDGTCFAQKNVTSKFSGVSSKIDGGNIIVKNNGDIYTLEMNFMLETGTQVKATYTGKIGTTPAESETPGDGDNTQTPELEVKDWGFTAALNGDILTLTGGDGTVITAKLQSSWGGVSAATYFFNDPDGVFKASDATFNGESVEADGTITINYNNYDVTLDMTINGVNYIGTSTNYLF